MALPGLVELCTFAANAFGLTEERRVTYSPFFTQEGIVVEKLIQSSGLSSPIARSMGNISLPYPLAKVELWNRVISVADPDFCLDARVGDVANIRYRLATTQIFDYVDGDFSRKLYVGSEDVFMQIEDVSLV